MDTRFVRDTDGYTGSIVLYHIVRHRPYEGSLTQWLRLRAAEYEKKHKGTYIEIEGMDEADFFERIEQGRLPDAYSFFSGTLYPDRMRTLTDLAVPYKDGIKDTARCIPYGFTGYCRLVRSPDGIGKTVYFANDLLAVYSGAEGEDASEEHADVLYLDLRRAGDLIRYRDGFALASIEPIDNFTDAVCWMGIDRDTDDRKADAILDFIAYLTSADVQKTLASIGMLSVRSDVRDVPPEASLKNIFKTYSSVRTVDPFLWQSCYDTLSEDAALARRGDRQAFERFTKRLRECCS